MVPHLSTALQEGVASVGFVYMQPFLSLALVQTDTKNYCLQYDTESRGQGQLHILVICYKS